MSGVLFSDTVYVRAAIFDSVGPLTMLVLRVKLLNQGKDYVFRD